MENTLKPCPFCGGEPRVSTYETESLWSHDIVTYTTVGCSECDISFSTEPGYEVEAPEAWNRRATPSVEQTVGVAIKPLKWKERDGVHVARCLAGTYDISRVGDTETGLWFSVSLNGHSTARRRSLVDAKDNAQGSFERAIRSALSHPEPVAQEAVTQADRDLLALRAVMPAHPSPSPEQGEDDLVQRLKDAVTDTFEHDAEGDGYYDTPLTFLVREAATELSALRARVAELEARATPQAGASADLEQSQ